MRLAKYLIPFISVVTAAAVQHIDRCGTPSPSEEHLAHADAIMESYRNGSVSFAAQADVTIPTYVHVVTTNAKRFRYTNRMIRDQIDVLNIYYRFMGIQFQLMDYEFTINDEYARAEVDSRAEGDMRRDLQKEINSYSTLNLYFLSDLAAERAEPLLGLCRFPVDSPTRHDRLFDGCLHNADTLPGGRSENYALGYTAVHEVGHWFYLLHPFNSGECRLNGDRVIDTPNQSTPSHGCPKGKDSCPDHPGLDSIHNFMDYSYDYCLTHFTNDQSQRARTLFNAYRRSQ